MIARPVGAIPLRVTMPAGDRSRRIGEPVTLGVPVGADLAQGAWSLRSGGTAVPVQATIQPAAPGAATRWLLIDFQADLTPGETATYELVPGDAPPLDEKLHVEEAGSGSMVVDTGSSTFVVPGRGDVLFSSARAGHGRGTSTAVWTTDADEQRRAVVFSPARVELAGPLRTVLRVDGSVVAGAPLRVTARLHFFARLGAVRVELSVTNPRPARHRGGYWELGDPGSVFFRDLSVTCSPDAPIAGASCSIDAGQPATVFALPLEIYQDSSGGENWRSRTHVNRRGDIPLSFRGYRVVSAETETRGLRASPIASVNSARGPIAAAMPQFWENFPKALEVADDEVTLRLFPRQTGDLHELQGGERKTHEFVLGFGTETVTPAAPLSWVRSPAVVSAPPDTYAAAGVWRPLSVGSAASRDIYRRLVMGAVDGDDSFAHKRERIDEYGWRHFGDLYADHEAVDHAGFVSHYNNQYDAIRGFAGQFCETGDPRWWSMACDLAGHVADVDIYHCEGDRTAYRGGMFWHTSHYVDAQSSTHRSYPAGSGSGGGPSCEHNYPSGLLLHYRLSGSERSREAVIGLADWVLRMDDGAQTRFRWVDRGPTGLASATRDPDYHGPGRGAAYSINALLDAHDLTGDPRYLSKAQELIRRCIHPADDFDRLELLDAERRWSYTVFLQVLGKYLEYRHADRDGDATFDYARAALVRYAAWMMGHDSPYLSRKEQLEYPTETWAAQDIRKAAVLEFAARYVPNGESKDAFCAAADRIFDESLHTLDAMPTRTLTRPVVLLLAYGFQRPLSDAAAPLVDPSVERFGPSRTNSFVPYKRRVLKRLGVAAVSLAAAAVVAVIVLLV